MEFDGKSFHEIYRIIDKRSVNDSTLVMTECTINGKLITDTKTQQVTLRGRIIQSASTEEEEGVPAHNYMALLLDAPIGSKQTLITELKVSIEWLGHYVDITGTLGIADIDGSAYFDAINRVEDVKN
jgi:DNA polymerase II small subunit/DNA polymerase delta subunit B